MEKRGLRFGIGLGIALLMYFTVAFLLGYGENVELRYFNGFITAGFIYFYLKGRANGDDMFAIMGDAFKVGMLGSVIFIISFLTFNTFIGADFLSNIELPASFESLNINLIYVVLFFESLFSSILISYVGMIIFRQEHYKSYKGLNKAE